MASRLGRPIIPGGRRGRRRARESTTGEGGGDNRAPISGVAAVAIYRGEKISGREMGRLTEGARSYASTWRFAAGLLGGARKRRGGVQERTQLRWKLYTEKKKRDGLPDVLPGSLLRGAITGRRCAECCPSQ